MSLRYYLYISDSKINIPLQQVDPGFGRKRTSEVGVGAKSPSEPGQYVRGRLPMRWGPPGAEQAVYFGGGTERTIVGLGGSGGHLLGASGAGEQHEVFASSTVPGSVKGSATALAGDGEAAPGSALAAVHPSVALGG